jgi:hypothetical protein
MSEWPAWVRQRLASLGVGSRRENEIVTELAQHFEDVAEDALARGQSEHEARTAAEGQVSDWASFRKRLRRAELGEDFMKQRLKSLWLPGLGTSCLSMLTLRLTLSHGHFPAVVWIGHWPMILSLRWLVFLPLVGALGAFASRRARGTPSEILLAAAFQSVAITSLFVTIIPFALFADHGPSLNTIAPIVGVTVLGWVVIPGIALIVGAAPFWVGAGWTAQRGAGSANLHN